jgi:SAM-dependent methyltransferase
VIRRELAWHEHEAGRRDALDAFLYDPPAFDSVVRSGLPFLPGDANTRVLDIGCGEGKDTLALSGQYQCVISVDLSSARLARARQLLRTQSPMASVSFVQANAEQLPFAPGTFEVIYGKAVLHHLDLKLAAREVHRLLVPDGKATFAEPMAQQPLLWLARRLTPKLRTGDERPLRYEELFSFARAFRFQACEAFFLLAPLAYVLRALPKCEMVFRRLHASLVKLDAQLFRRYPALARWAWYAIVKIQT